MPFYTVLFSVQGHYEEVCLYKGDLSLKISWIFAIDGEHYLYRKY